MTDSNNKAIAPTPGEGTSGRRGLPDFGVLTRPLSLRGWPVWLVYLLAAVGLIYLLNPGAGLVDFIPDVIPGIGNLDEGLAAMLVWYGLVEFFEGRKFRQPPPENPQQ